MFEFFKKKMRNPSASKHSISGKAIDSIDLFIPHSDLWLLSYPDVVWDFAKKADYRSYVLFFEYVNGCIERRIELASPTNFDPTTQGSWLIYYPENALFEDVAIGRTSGFFGSGDCPPPAFWTHVDKGAVVSFIPQRFVEIASVGVDICVNDTLVWG